MSSNLELYAYEAYTAVNNMAMAFHLSATNTEGAALRVPCTYQIAEPGFRPFRSGKASPEELQGAFDEIVGLAVDRGIDLGIESDDSVTKIALQQGLGIDCSNFAARALTAVHAHLELPAFYTSVYRAADDIRRLHHDKGSWVAKDNDGNDRLLTGEEAQHLATEEWLSIDWIATVFGKDPEFITGSSHLTSEQSARKVYPVETLPGDVIAFEKAGKAVVSHVGVVEAVVAEDDGIRVDFWHSWHTRDFESGLRRDRVLVHDNGTSQWSHPGLGDSLRYQGYYFARPIGLDALVKSL